MALTKVSTGVVDMSSSTGGLIIAKGTTAQQPTCTAANLGSIRENTTENKVEVCTAGGGTPAWQFLEEAGTSIVPLTVQYLVVAGGGGAWIGGGGAGGLLTNVGGTALSLNTATTYNVTVGDGGAGAATYSGTSVNGSNSIFDSLTSIGGGFGGQNFGPGGATGGSGGGGAPFASSNPGSGGLGTSGQGSNGGASATYASANGGFYGGGGGGGAGALGGNGTVSSPTLTGGNGGNGLQNNITGTNTYYAGGGGGGVHGDISSYTSGAGGSGGGGNGAIQPSSSGGAAGSNAIANTGGGGGGGASYQSVGGFTGGAGGSGVVILRYPDAYSTQLSTGGGLISAVDSTSVPGYKIETITAGSGTITFA